ncbi:MAG: DUF87 domain-containing protein [Firmicutes bacterium]|nr:DUF87 domain-containing protein [Bacillota bacterium]
MNDREIGRIISVDSFRIVIELNSDLKGLYKSGYYDLYQIAKINSYVIIPVAEDKIVAIITRVRINDETEIEASTGMVSLPKSKRYIIATLTGTITGKKQEYIQGVYNFPVLDNPVWYVMEEELKVIFDYKDNTDDKEIDFKNDYYLPIGTSPIFNDFEVKINPDKLFCKHAAVLGNTGCGKSCTVSTILQSIFTYKLKSSKDEEEKCVKNAHFIIFDTNGEYKKAFKFQDKEINNRVNTFTINREGLRVPYWFMNYEDFDYLFKPSPNAQAPILRRAIELAKNKHESENKNEIPREVINLLEHIRNLCLNCSNDDHKELKEIIYENYEYIMTFDMLKDVFPFEKEDYIKKNPYYDNKGNFIRNYYNDVDDNYLNTEVKSILIESINNKLQQIYNEKEAKKAIQEQNVDIPKWFNFKQMIDIKVKKF